MRAHTEQRYWVGFDLGGSKMLAVVYDSDFRGRAERKRTRGHGGSGEGLGRIVALIEAALEATGASREALAGMA